MWNSARQIVAVSHSLYHVIAVDSDLAGDSSFMARILQLLSTRADSGWSHSLPLRVFDTAQVETAFRILQGGRTVGKVVVRFMRVRHLEAAHATQLVTGGTSGLGLLTARWLAQRGAGSLLLVSRSGRINNDAGPESEQLRLSSATVRVERCDVSELQDTRLLAATALCDHRSLNGVFHAAGVLSDGVLLRQSALMLRHVYAPKVVAASWLLAATLGSALQTLVLFSSTAALLGGGAQANYSAANTCLDSLAARRRTKACTGVSIQWGPWAEVGMASGAAVSSKLEAAGFGLVGLAHGMRTLHEAQRMDTPAVLTLFPVKWSRFLSSETDAPAFLSNFARLAPRVCGPASSTAASVETVGVDLNLVLHTAAQIAGAAVDADSALMEAGLDSLGAVELRNQLQQLAHSSLPGTLIFSHPTVRQLAILLACEPAAASVTVSATEANDSSLASAREVAMAGLGVLLPNGIGSAAAAWRVVGSAGVVVTRVPAERWPTAENAINEIERRVSHGGFVSRAELFDNVLFSISPAEAGAMDPQQRLLLERGYEALRAAEYDRASLTASNLLGVFVGIENHDFDQILGATSLGQSVYAATGSSLAIASGRLSYVLGLEGPCMAYATACSAALAASHSAFRALQRDECAAALSFGASLILTPVVSLGFATAGMTSGLGRCHTFDRRADGYARGEGCSGVALDSTKGKLLMVGSAVRQDGKSASLTAPNGQAQRRLLTSALADANAPATLLSLVEAHGTGTALGDPIEVGSLREAALVWQSNRVALAVSSVKANSGHAEPAAGAAGLVTLALKLEEGAAPRNAQLNVLNTHVKESLQASACVMPTQLGQQRAPREEERTLGGVSSFGYSGTIVHAALDSRPQLSRDRTSRFKTTLTRAEFKRKRFGVAAPQAPPDKFVTTQLYSMVWALPPVERNPAPSAVQPKASAVMLHPATYGCLGASLHDKKAEGARMLDLAFLDLWPERSGASMVAELGSDPRPFQVLAIVFDAADGVAPGQQCVEHILQLGPLLQRIAPAPLLLLTSGVHTPSRVSTAAALSPAAGTTWGLVRVLRLEEPGLRVLSADVGPSVEVTAVRDILSDARSSAEFELAWQGSLRYTGRLCLRSSLAALLHHANGEAERGGYIITGGLGGLGVRAAALLVERGAARIMLTSRSGRAARGEQGLTDQLHALEASRRSSVEVAVGDAADACELATLTQRSAAARPGALAGVLHAAGVVKDVLLRSMEPAHLRAVFAPKATGARTLHHGLVRQAPLDALVFFSSTAAAVGNVGQGNYAAANAFLDALAACRNGCGAPAYSLQLPMVTGAGMGQALIASSSSSAARGLAELSMDLETYAGLLRAVLAARFISGGVPSDAALPTALQRVLFSLPGGEGADGAPGGIAQTSSLVMELLRLPPADRTEHLAPLVLECVRGVVECTVDPDAPLADVGVDSIASTELARLLEAPLGISLPVNLVANFSTPNGIAKHLADVVGSSAPGPSSHASGPPALAPVEAAPLLADPLAAPGVLPWHVAYDGAELVHGGQVLRIIPREGGDVGAWRDPLVFVHSIVGQIPTPSLKRLQFALGQRELLALTHEGYTSGLALAFAPVSMREFARKYAISLMGARQMGAFHLMGL